MDSQTVFVFVNFVTEDMLVRDTIVTNYMVANHVSILLTASLQIIFLLREHNIPIKGYILDIVSMIWSDIRTCDILKLVLLVSINVMLVH